MDLGSILSKAAPWLAAAASGPAGLAGMAVKTIAEAVGASDQTTESITAAVAGATPEQLAALKKADQDFAVRMRELGINEVKDILALEVDDRKNARDLQKTKPSPMPAVLTCGTGIAFLGTLAALFYFPIPPGNRDLIVYMCGQLAAAFAACSAFWIGTTRHSEDKTGLLAKAEPIK